MCIVSLAWRAHPRWKLVVMGNRDEMHARPAAPLARWKDADHVLAGRDVSAGGTWLGVSEQGRFAVVTNVAGNGMPDPALESRGKLLSDFLTGTDQHISLSVIDFSAFNPFNLITISNDDAMLFSNQPEESRKLPSGIFGLSNGSLDSPWSKSAILNKMLNEWIKDGPANPEILLEKLTDQTPPTKLQKYAEVKGPKDDPENAPVFICNPVYGTRCSSVVVIDDQNRGTIMERRFDPGGNPVGETSLNFTWP